MGRIVSRGYWRSIRRLAFAMSYKWFGGPRGFCALVAVSALAIPLVGAFYGWQEAVKEMVVASVPLLLMIVLLAVNVVRAPRVLHEQNLRSIADIERQRDELADKFTDDSRRQQIRDTLARLLEDFQAFTQRPMPDEEGVSALRSDFALLQTTAQSDLGRILPRSDVLLFMDLGRVPLARRSGNREAANIFATAVAHQRNLVALLNRYHQDVT